MIDSNPAHSAFGTSRGARDTENRSRSSPMSRWCCSTLLALCGILMILCLPAQGGPKDKHSPSRSPSQTATPKPTGSPSDVLHESDERVYGDYTLRIAHTVDDQGSRGSLVVFKKAEPVYTLTGNRFFFGHVYSDEPALDNELIAIGKDITGNGAPNAVVSEWSGGAHCCFTFHIYELGTSFREVATLDAGHGDLAHFASLDADAGLEFVTSDWTFASWRTGFAQSPAPPVILRFKDGAYGLALDLMRKPRPSQDVLIAEARKVRNDPAWTPKAQPPSLWDYMLQLIYGGNGRLAREFLDKAWPMSIPGKEEFYRDFRATLSQSPYWKAILKLNDGQIN